MNEDQITDKLKSTCKNLTELLLSGYTASDPSYFDVAKALVYSSNALLQRDVNGTIKENAQSIILLLTLQIEAYNIKESLNVPSRN